MCCMLNTMTCRVYALNIWINKDNFEDLSPQLFILQSCFPRNQSQYSNLCPQSKHIHSRGVYMTITRISQITRTSPPIISLQEPDKQDCKTPIRNRHWGCILVIDLQWSFIGTSIFIYMYVNRACVILYVWCCLQYGYSLCTIKQYLKYLKFIPPRIVREYYHPEGALLLNKSTSSFFFFSLS